MKTMNEVNIDQLREEGYAVAVFAPSELNGVDPDQVELLLTESGEKIINTLAKLVEKTS